MEIVVENSSEYLLLDVLVELLVVSKRYYEVSELLDDAVWLELMFESFGCLEV